MVNYKYMYSTLCAAMSDAIDSLEKSAGKEEAVEILLCALREAENMYIEAADGTEE